MKDLYQRVRVLQKFDWISVLLILLIVLFGLAALYSIGLGREDLTFFKRHILFVGIGFFLYFLIGTVDYRVWKRYAFLLYGLAVLLLLGVLIFGETIRGTRGWFVFGGYQFQVIELVKFFLIIALAAVWNDAPRPLSQSRNLLLTLAMTGGVFILTAFQPDLGSALILLLVWFGMIAMIGLQRWQWGMLFLVVGIGSIFSWFFFLAPYQKERIVALFSLTTEETLTIGYSVRQSVIAIGSGRLIGTGLGFGSQSQLKFLPESHTDFIFAVVAEELGFVGVLFLLGSIMLFLLRMSLLSRRLEDEFAMFFVLGATLLFFFQTVLNIGVTLGLLPVTGLPFPLVSYGGSSLLVSFLILGVVQNIFVS